MNNVLYLWETRYDAKQWELVDLDRYPNFVDDMRKRSDIKRETLIAMPVTTDGTTFKYQLRDKAFLERANFVDWDHFYYDFSTNFLNVETHKDDNKYGFVSPDGHYYYAEDGDIESMRELALSYVLDEERQRAIDNLINYSNWIMIYANPAAFELETDSRSKYIIMKSEKFETTLSQMETLRALGLEGCFGWSVVERMSKQNR